MRPTERERRTTDTPFETTSSTSFTRSDRYRRTVDTWVYAPLAILWNDWRARVGALVIFVYGFVGTFGVMIVEPTGTNDGEPYMGAFQSMAFPLGTDQYGQDVFALLIHSTPAMLEMILAGGVFTTLVAAVVGIVGGYKGGRVDDILTVFTDIVLNIPGLPLLVVLAAILEPDQPWLVGIVLSLNAWAGLARSLRSQMLTLRNNSYVEVSRIMGTPVHRIILKDVLPNLMPYIMINFVNSARNIIFASVGLYFLGILPFTNLNWGVMMNLAYESGALVATSMYHWLLPPLFAIIGLSTGLILFSQGLDRVFNPRIRAQHADSIEGDE